MAKVRLTKKYIEALDGKDARYSVGDSDAKGMSIVVTPHGGKSFYWMGRSLGRVTRIMLGKFPELAVERARTMAKRIEADVREGLPATKPPKTRVMPKSLTLGSVFDWWYKNYATSKTKDPARRERRFEMAFEQWRELPLDNINSAMVDELHAQIGADRGKSAANHSMRLLNQLFVCALKKRGWRGVNPVEGLVYFEEVERDRFLTENELPKFFEAIAKINSERARDFFALCLWTGARRGNVASMEWKEIQDDTWVIPASKAKMKQSMRIVLPPQAKAIIESRRGKHERFVFGSRTSVTGHYVCPKKAWKTLKDATGLDDIRIHDLRRTLGSWQAMQGSSLLVIGKSLGHTSTDATKVYARLQMDPVRVSVEGAADAIEAIVKKSEKSGK